MRQDIAALRSLRSGALALLYLLAAAAAVAQTVYITRTGSRYHLANCRYLTDSKLPVELEDALDRGYRPCEVCHPPVVFRPGPSTPVLVRDPVVREIEGRVVSIHDGDTLTLLVGSVQHKIRLNGIDAPELGQAFGRNSREHLGALCFGKDVRVRVVDRDRYGREVGDVFVGGTLANAEMVRAGLAWHYKEFSTDTSLAALEDEARARGRGLWADQRPLPPWDYRDR